MKTELNELVDFITNKIFISADIEFKKYAFKNLVQEEKYNMLDYLNLHSNSNLLLSLTEQQLYWFVECYDSYFNTNFTEQYFTPEELDGFEIYIKPCNTENFISEPAKESSFDYLYELKNVNELAEGQYVTTLSVEDIAIMSKENIIISNPISEKECGFENAFVNEFLNLIYIKKSRVKEIAQSIQKNEYYYNTIRLNIMYDEDNPLVYDETRGSLSMPKNVKIIVPDGSHRQRACQFAYYGYPENRDEFKNNRFVVIVTNYSKEEIAKLLSQEWSFKKISSDIKNTMLLPFGNDVINYVKYNPNANERYSKGIIAFSSRSGGAKGLIKKGELVVAIERFYKTNEDVTNETVIDIGEWLVTVFNWIITEYFNELKYVENWLFKAESYIIFIQLSSLVKGELNWKLKLTEFLNAIDWSDFNFYKKEIYDKHVEVIEMKVNEVLGGIK